MRSRSFWSLLLRWVTSRCFVESEGLGFHCQNHPYRFLRRWVFFLGLLAVIDSRSGMEWSWREAWESQGAAIGS